MMPPKKRESRSAPPREYPNRIFELMKERGWTYETLAPRIDDVTHPKTVAKIAKGQIELTFSWMQRFARAFGVKPTEIIERPTLLDHRTVTIRGSVRAGHWSDSHAFDPQAPGTVTIPTSDNDRNLDLYALTVEGESMNRLYPPGSIVILSTVQQRPGEIMVGKRYHVIRKRGDVTEETLKTLVRDRDGEYWLQPETDSPEFSAFRLEGDDSETVELRGRVQRAITVE